MNSNDRNRLRELHLWRMKGQLTGREQIEYKELKRGWKARRICKDLDQVYKDPDFQELLRTKPTEQRWYDLVEKLSNT